MIHSRSLKPTGRLVLSEAIYQEFSPAGLLIPPEAQERYPFVGRVISIGASVKEDIRPDDFAIFSTEIFDAPNTYLDHFSITLRDGLENLVILVSIDIEPYFKEQMETYSKNPSTEDRWIQVQDIQTDEAFKFLASDVLDFGPARVRASSVQKLRYVETLMFPLLSDDGIVRLFYLTDEREIEAIVRSEDAQDQN